MPITRDTIWCNVKRNKLKDIQCYQPEDDGYEVVSISLGTCTCIFRDDDTALL